VRERETVAGSVLDTVWVLMSFFGSRLHYHLVCIPPLHVTSNLSLLSPDVLHTQRNSGECSKTGRLQKLHVSHTAWRITIMVWFRKQRRDKKKEKKESKMVGGSVALLKVLPTYPLTTVHHFLSTYMCTYMNAWRPHFTICIGLLCQNTMHYN